MASGSCFRCHPAVAWSVEKSSIILFRSGTNDAIELRHPESALWDFLSRGIQMERITAMMCVLRSSTQQSAELWIKRRTAEWLRAGWLIQGDRIG